MEKNLFKIFICIIATIAMNGCANMAQGPTGGYKDTIPPTMLRSVPENNAKNVKTNKIEIYFDEYVNLNNAQKELMISPTQEKNYTSKAIGKKITVELNDSLLPNTTYTIDFGNSVQDFRESNPAGNFYISFSTGSDIDSMDISGYVLDAQDFSPSKDFIVGVYSNLDDFLFTTTKVERIATTKEDGSFIFHNLKPQPYKIVALKDETNNKYFDQPTEAIAFLSETITPHVDIIQKKDTIFKDSITIDTIVTKTIKKFYPDSIILYSFLEENKQQFFEKAERKEKDYISFYFKNNEKITPKLRLINVDNETWGLPEFSVTKDTFSYWIADTILAKMDTLTFELEFKKYDSINNLITSIDTIDLTFNHKKEKKVLKHKKKKKEFLSYSANYAVEINNRFMISWDKPVQKFNADMIKTELLVDTTWTEIKHTVEPNNTTSTNRCFYVDFNFEPEKKYRLTIDSAAVNSIYGIHNDSITMNVRMKSIDEYSNLSFNLQNVPQKAIAELCSGNNVIKSIKVTEDKIKFENIKAGEYIVRIFEDKNNDGKWTTGNYKEKRLPEKVFYYNKKFKLKAGWDMEEDWDLNSKSPLEQQKFLQTKK